MLPRAVQLLDQVAGSCCRDAPCSGVLNMVQSNPNAICDQPGSHCDQHGDLTHLDLSQSNMK